LANQATPTQLLEKYGLNAENIVERLLKKVLGRSNFKVIRELYAEATINNRGFFSYNKYKPDSNLFFL